MLRVACPNCSARHNVADDLAADARVRCDQCGKRFSPHSASADDTPLELDGPDDEAGGRHSRVILLAACGGLVLLVASVAVGWLVSRPTKRDEPPVAVAPPADPQPPAKKEPEPPPPLKPRKPPGDGQHLTAADLLTRYQTSPAGAKQYDGANITVTGTLADPATQYPDGEVAVRLAGSRHDGPCVWCRIPAGPNVTEGRFPVGATITVRGRCAGAGAARGPAGYAPADADEVVLADCEVVAEPLLPTPDGVDYPKGITHDGIEVKITAAYVGRPVVILGGGGPNAGARALTAEKYLVLKMQVRNSRKVDFMASYVYSPPDGSQVKLTDEKGNRFGWCYSDAPAEPGTVVAQELAADPKRKWRFRDEPINRILDPGTSETYLLVFSADHLGKGTRLFLSLPNRVFGELKYDQIIRFEQSAVEPLPTNPPAMPPAPGNPGTDKPPASDPALDARVADLATQLAKGKTPADRMKAADELLKLGTKAKLATGPLCRALFDPSTQVRVAALDSLKKVNPDVYAPVATLVSPLSDTDLLFMGSSGRPEAVAALVKLGAEGRAAVPILAWYKTQISQPGGWPQVPAVVDALAALAPDDPSVVTLLVQGLLKDVDGPSRLAAAKGLQATKATKESVAALATAVRTDREADVRLAAVTALGKMGADAKAAMKAVEAARMDPDQRVREAARDALDKIK